MIPFPIALTHDDIAQLHTGRGINIASHRLGHGTNVLLTPEQHKRAKHAQHHKKKYHLRMGGHQFRHNVMHGKGIWDTFKNAAKKVLGKAKEVLVPLAKEKLAHAAKTHLPGLVEKVGHKVLDAVGKRAGNHAIVNNLLDKGRERVSGLASHLGTFAHKKISGSGMKGSYGASMIPRRLSGRGLFVQTV